MAPKPKLNTLTTTGRLAKDAYEREQQQAKAAMPKLTPSEPLTGDVPSRPPPKKKRRVTNHAPPGERAAEAAAKALAREKKKAARKAPLTTKEKQAAHAARQRKARQSVVHDGSSLRVLSEENEMSSVGERAKESETRNLNLMDFMRELGQMSSTPVQKGRKKAVVAGGRGRESVLVRATEKTRRLKVEVGGGFESKAKGTGGPGLMALPIELRQRIWRQVVVETRFFVYPASSPEQPDLAMTSRQIRREVLPIYYGENTFVVEVPSAIAKGKTTKASPSLMPVKKWANALQSAKHLEQISKWAFIWIPTTASNTGTAGLDSAASNEDAIVSLQFPVPRKKRKPKMEIHKQAFCMLSSHEQHVPCVLKKVPKWLNDAVTSALLEKEDRGEQVMAIAVAMRQKGGELVESRCKLLKMDDGL